ncbi:MAG: DUF2909 domain-containing protein [Proteobacteria bacterium]|nr:DUF2909 domain-containing protein [Pseudomonadota bacterium]
MLVRWFVVCVLIVIFYCLISALYYLLYRKDVMHMVKALSWRIGLSVLLFVFLFLAYGLGWIHPHPLAP